MNTAFFPFSCTPNYTRAFPKADRRQNMRPAGILRQREGIGFRQGQTALYCTRHPRCHPKHISVYRRQSLSQARWHMSLAQTIERKTQTEEIYKIQFFLHYRFLSFSMRRAF